MASSALISIFCHHLIDIKFKAELNNICDKYVWPDYWIPGFTNGKSFCHRQHLSLTKLNVDPLRDSTPTCVLPQLIHAGLPSFPRFPYPSPLSYVLIHLPCELPPCHSWVPFVVCTCLGAVVQWMLNWVKAGVPPEVHTGRMGLHSDNFPILSYAQNCSVLSIPSFQLPLVVLFLLILHPKQSKVLFVVMWSGKVSWRIQERRAYTMFI